MTVLSKIKVLAALQNKASHAKNNNDAHYQTIRRLWQAITSNNQLYQEICRVAHAEMIAMPESLELIPIPSTSFFPYTVAAVDGSQIFPDPHTGIHSYLLNIGTCMLSYREKHSTAEFSSEPSCHEPDGYLVEEDIALQRTLLELRTATDLLQQHSPTLLLVDGPLMPFQKNVEPSIHKKLFHQWRENSFNLAGYISLPQGRMVSNMMNIAARILGKSYNSHFSDSTILSLILPPYHRTPLWQSSQRTSRVSSFFYHTGSEIARIEIPTYLTQQSSIEQIMRVIHHQILLGYGYPIALAEAHVQATVSMHDQQWFCTVLAQYDTHSSVRSYKQLRKQRIPL